MATGIVRLNFKFYLPDYREKKFEVRAVGGKPGSKLTKLSCGNDFTRQGNGS